MVLFDRNILKQVRIEYGNKSDKAYLCLLHTSMTTSSEDVAKKYITASEFQRWSQFKSEKRKIDFLLGRHAARIALNELLGHESETLTISQGEHSEPILPSPYNEQYRISISHSGPFALALAFPRQFQLSVDLETTRTRDVPHLKKNQMTEEKLTLEHLPLDEDRKFQLCWTVKESLAKALVDHSGIKMSDYKLKKVFLNSDKKNYISEFVNFEQYQSLTYLDPEFTFSIAHEKRVHLDIEQAK